MANIFRKLRGDVPLRRFVERLGLTAQAWHRWERNLSSPSIKSIKKIKEVLGVDIYAEGSEEERQVINE